MTKTTKELPEKDILKTFYGTTNIPDLVVLTPIGRIYEKAKERFYIKERKAWWHNFTGKTGTGKKVMVAKVGVGSAIVDPILSAQKRCNYLLLLGHCGGFHPNMEYGDITVATDSYFESDDKIYKPKSDLSLVSPLLPSSIPGTNLTIESVMREMESIIAEKPNYLKPGTVSVDMETAFLYRDSNVPSASIMVVTDLPKVKSKTFVDGLTSDERKRIATGQMTLVDSILTLIDLL